MKSKILVALLYFAIGLSCFYVADTAPATPAPTYEKYYIWHRNDWRDGIYVIDKTGFGRKGDATDFVGASILGIREANGGSLLTVQRKTRVNWDRVPKGETIRFFWWMKGIDGIEEPPVISKTVMRDTRDIHNHD